MLHLLSALLLVTVAVAQIPGPVQIQSKNYPTKYFGSDNDFDFKISTTPYALNEVEGLAGTAGTVSFQSAADSNKYLRHFDYKIYLEDRTSGRNPDIFDEDATFKVLFTADGYYQFQAVNKANHYIRHQNTILKIDGDDDSMFAEDSRFKVIGQPARVQSKNYPTKYFGSENGFDIKILTDAMSLQLVPGLDGGNWTVSFQSTADSNKYLRHLDWRIYLEDRTSGRNPDIFDEDASFKVVFTADGYVQFQSVNKPNHYIRHQDTILKIDGDNDLKFAEDSRFTVLPF